MSSNVTSCKHFCSSPPHGTSPFLKLLLGSYRDNEVNRSHPLSCKLNELQEQGANQSNIFPATLYSRQILCIRLSNISRRCECSQRQGWTYRKRACKYIDLRVPVSSTKPLSPSFFSGTQQVWRCHNVHSEIHAVSE